MDHVRLPRKYPATSSNISSNVTLGSQPMAAWILAMLGAWRYIFVEV
jgi:hypothetical protein